MKPRIPISVAIITTIVTIPPARELISSRYNFGFPLGVLLVSIAISVCSIAIWQLMKGQKDE